MKFKCRQCSYIMDVDDNDLSTGITCASCGMVYKRKKNQIATSTQVTERPIMVKVEDELSEEQKGNEIAVFFITCFFYVLAFTGIGAIVSLIVASINISSIKYEEKKGKYAYAALYMNKKIRNIAFIIIIFYILAFIVIGGSLL